MKQNYYVVDSKFVNSYFPRRKKHSRKGDNGKVLIIGGSEVYSGAAALAALAALRAGCDIVMVVAPERAANIIASFSPCLITYPVKGKFFTEKHADKLAELASRFDAVLIGPGTGREKETGEFVNGLLSRIEIPCVLDADALKLVKKDHIRSNFILTPHTKEFEYLSGIKLKNQLDYDSEKVKSFAKEAGGCTLLVKGCVDIVSDGERIAINTTGNALMSAGGTGDVLAGICASLLARKVEPFEAACISAYINGKAGDVWMKEKRYGLIATDVIEKIPEAINRCVRRTIE